MFSKIKQYAVAHKIITVVVLVIIAWGAYAAYSNASKPAAVTTYVVEDAAQGTVIASVSGSGQVQADTTVDVKPQNSETVTQIFVQPGDHVDAGQPLIQMDTTNEEKAVQSAQLSLQSAQLALAKLQEISTTTLLQDQDSLATGQSSLLNASTTLANDYGNGFDTIAATFVDLQSLMTDLNNFISGTQVDKVHANPDAYVDLMPNYLQASTEPYRNQLVAAYTAAVAAYQQNLTDFHAANRNSSQATLAALFTETQSTANLIDTTIKGGTDLLDYVVDNYPSAGFVALPTITTTYQTDFGNYTNTINSDLNSLSGITTTITNDQQALANQEASLVQASTSYTELVAGPDPLDVESQNISIENAQMALQTAQQNLAYDTVTAPISGIIATMPSVIGETVASPAATIVSDSEIAEVTLNEIDAAKVQLGNKATLTFDAFPDLSLAGTVVEIDPVGTVSEGVVNYNVQIGFSQPSDTSSTEMVKPGMSVTADIVTQVDQNVIAVPNGAIHTEGTAGTGGASYVLEPAMPLSSMEVTASQSGGVALPNGTKMVPVTVGITNDTLTEIDSGVNVGDQIITQTITTTASAAKAATGGTSALSALTGGGARAGGGGFTGGAAGGGGYRGGGAGIP